MGSSETSTSSLSILTLNCWGLKYLSTYRRERLSEIGRRLATHQPPLEIVGLQECWTYSDYLNIRETTKDVLPYGKFYHSGIFGGGLVILSRWPILESSMFRYPLNGRPTAFFRGDWFVGKGVAWARIKTPDGQSIEVFNTHLHAPYEREPNDSYMCHRTAQAWEIAKLMRQAGERGSLVIGLGDFNMVPMSFAHALIEGAGGGVRDVWRILHPASSIGASIDNQEILRRRVLDKTVITAIPDVTESLDEHGHTCDSVLNTWRWTKEHQKDLRSGKDRKILMTDDDPRAKRLDYIFFGDHENGWTVSDVSIGMTERHPTLLCSLSDHFSVHAIMARTNKSPGTPQIIEIQGLQNDPEHVSIESDIAEMREEDLEKVTSHQPTTTKIAPGYYEAILAMIHRYTLRERQQRRWRMAHFFGSALISIGSFVAVWWSPHNFVAFILILVSSLGLMAGTVDGLIGGLFVGSELRALVEFEWEVRNALEGAGGSIHVERKLKDWYD